MHPYLSLSDEFYLYSYLNTEMELPKGRDTVLHFFDQVRKAFPKMTNFQGRDPQEYTLEEDKELGSYRWMALESRRVASGYLNPPSLEDCHAQHELMLDLAPHLLSVNSLDCEALDVMFGFDFAYTGNHDDVVAEVFASEGKFGSLISLPNSKLVNYEPTFTLALDEQMRLQCRLSVVTRSQSFQAKANPYSDEAISVYFTVRQYWGLGTDLSFIESYRKQFEIGAELVDQHIVPNVVVPLSEAISAR